MLDIWYIAGIIFFLFGIGISIGLHEIGHLWPAKKFGVKVPTYAIGFGPTLFKIKRGETTYSIKLLPIGGYITMIGMHPPEPQAKKAAKKTQSKKAGSDETGSDEAGSTTTKLGFFAGIIHQARTAHSEHVTPADQNRMFYQLSTWKRLVIMFGGPFMNLLLGLVLMAIAVSGIGTLQGSNTVAKVMPCVVAGVSTEEGCTDSDPVSPAYAVGLKPGDRIISINGTKVTNPEDIRRAFSSGENHILEIEPAGSKTIQTAVITPISQDQAVLDANGNPVLDENGQPRVDRRSIIGIQLANERITKPISKAVEESFWNIGQVGQMIINLPKHVIDTAVSTFAGQERNPEGAVSIVGIAQVSGAISTNENIEVIDKLSVGLIILASLNFALFVFNMLPLLPLDGGHIISAIYGAIKRGIFRVLRKPDPGPVDTARLMPFALGIFILLMFMGVFFIAIDLINPIKF